ncbi:hypothetical protein P7C70_g4038, partial [Phenoliferia sp. Uapishka_3]
MSSTTPSGDDGTPQPSTSSGAASAAAAKQPITIVGPLSPPHTFSWEYDGNRSIIPGTFATNRGIALAALEYVVQERTVEARDRWLADLDAALARVEGLHVATRTGIAQFWRAALLGFSEGPTWDESTMEDSRESLHPLVYALVAGGGIASFDASRDALWFDNGKWRNKRPAGTTAPTRSRAVSQSGDTPTPVVAAPPPINFGFAGIPTDDGHPDWHDEEDEQEAIIPASPPRIPAAAKGKSTIARPTAAIINEAATAAHTARFLGEFDRAGEGLANRREEAPNRTGGLTFDNSDVDSLWAGLDQRVQIQRKDSLETPHQREVNSWYATYRAAKSFPKSDARNLIRNLERLGSQLNKLTLIEICLGEYTELEDVRDASAQPLPPMYEGLEDHILKNLTALKAERKRAPITNFWDFMRSLQTYQQAVVLLLPCREDELKFYVNFHEVSGKFAEPWRVNLLISYDRMVRQEILVPNGRIKSLFDVGFGCPIYMEMLLKFAPGPGNAGGKRKNDEDHHQNDSGEPERRRRREEKASNEICKRFNDLAPHSVNCARKHICSACKGRHALPHCPNRGMGNCYEALDWEPFDLAFADSLPAPPPAPAHDLAGIGPAPKIRRKFHYPDPSIDPPRTPLVDWTLKAPPLPAPPPLAFDCEVSWRTINENPSLFSHGHTIDTHAFIGALDGHPNRPWVESLEERFSEGFWPAHNGMTPVPPDPNKYSRAFRQPNEKDAAFIELTATEERVKGWISPAFPTLLPGMVASPWWVARSDNHRDRIVTDHSISGLNDNILKSETPAHYDSVEELGRDLRWLHHHFPELRDQIVLWKLDVSSAFRLLWMHYLWQLRQAFAVWYLQPDGSRKLFWHLDWRGVFGNRAMPYLWTDVMGAFMWISMQKPYSLERSKAYMDDAFSADITGRLVSFTHEGITISMPTDQATMAKMFQDFRLPFKLSKGPHGVRLVVCGLEYDAAEMTVTMAPEALELLERATLDFLDNSVHGRQRPLRLFWRQGGWWNWFLTIRPLAKPLVSEIYDKTRGLKHAHEPVYMNVPVRNALEMLVEELRYGEKLSLMEPGIFEWKECDADFVIYSDACLATLETGCSGLGFWYVLDGIPQYFYSRPDQRYKKIPFAEAIASVAGVLQVLSLRRPFNRMMVRSDSSTWVYALDSGAAEDLPYQPLRTLVLAVYNRIRTRKFDIRAWLHYEKTLAITFSTSIHHFGSLVRTRFEMPNVHFAARPRPNLLRPRQPLPPISELITYRNHLVHHSIDASTRAGYAGHYKSWLAFALHYGFEPLPTEQTLSLFVAWRWSHTVSVAQCLSGLAFFLTPLMIDPTFAAIRYSSLVRRAHRGGAKTREHIVKKALPLPSKGVDDLVKGVMALEHPSYEQLLFAAIIVILFYCCARGAEATMPDNIAYRNPRKWVRRSTVVLDSTSFSARLPYHKADPTYKGSQLYFHASQSGKRALDLVRRWLHARDRLFGNKGHLFLRDNGTVPTRSWVARKLKKFFGDEFSLHSPRPGGATFYILCGWAEATVQRMGRWKSAAWKEYIRINPELQKALIASEGRRLATSRAARRRR